MTRGKSAPTVTTRSFERSVSASGTAWAVVTGVASSRPPIRAKAAVTAAGRVGITSALLGGRKGCRPDSVRKSEQQSRETNTYEHDSRYFCPFQPQSSGTVDHPEP